MTAHPRRVIGRRLAVDKWVQQSFRPVDEFPSLLHLDKHLQPPHMGASDLRWAGDRWLLVPQDHDEQVPMKQFTRTRRALVNAGRKPAVESIGANIDGFLTMPARVQVYERFLDFLKDNIGN